MSNRRTCSRYTATSPVLDKKNSAVLKFSRPLTVSSRGVGFVVHSTYEYIQHRLRGGREEPDEGCTIHQLYRLSLAQFTEQLSRATGITKVLCPPFWNHITVPYHASFLKRNEDCHFNFRNIANLINSVGSFEYKPYNIVYRYKPVQCKTMPFYMRLNYSNLRDYVLRMSDEETPSEERLDNYNHNPLPGADWGDDPENPVLRNPDEIMPADFDALSDDVSAVRMLLNGTRHSLDLHGGVVHLDGQGALSQLPAVLSPDFKVPTVRETDGPRGSWCANVYANLPVPQGVLTHAMFLMVGETLKDDTDAQPPWTTRPWLTAVKLSRQEAYDWNYW